MEGENDARQTRGETRRGGERREGRTMSASRRKARRKKKSKTKHLAGARRIRKYANVGK